MVPKGSTSRRKKKNDKQTQANPVVKMILPAYVFTFAFHKIALNKSHSKQISFDRKKEEGEENRSSRQVSDGE